MGEQLSVLTYSPGWLRVSLTSVTRRYFVGSVEPGDELVIPSIELAELGLHVGISELAAGSSGLEDCALCLEPFLWVEVVGHRPLADNHTRFTILRFSGIAERGYA